MEEYKLMFKAALQRCTNLQLSGGFNNPNNSYGIEIKCKRCKESQVIEVSLGQVKPPPSTGKVAKFWKCPVHFSQKCENGKCQNQIVVKMFPVAGKYDVPYERNSKVEYKEIMRFIFDGAKPLSFTFAGLWEFEYDHLPYLGKCSCTLDDVYKGHIPHKEQNDLDQRILFVDAEFVKCKSS